MDTAKFEYFVAKYRATDPDEFKDLASRAASLAEEAEAALRQVAAERGISVQAVSIPESPALKPRQAARAAEESAYSAAGAELVHIRKVWFLWSIPVALAAGFVYGFMAESAKGTFMGPPVALVNSNV